TSEVDGAFGGAHSSWEISVGGGDAGFGGVEPAEGVGRASQTGAASGGSELAAGVDQDIRDGFFVGTFFDASQVEAEHVRVDFGGAGDDEGFNFHLTAFEDVGGEDHVGDFPAGARADVGSVKFYLSTVLGRVAIVRRVGLGDERLQRAEIPLGFEIILGG